MSVGCLKKHGLDPGTIAIIEKKALKYIAAKAEIRDAWRQAAQEHLLDLDGQRQRIEALAAPAERKAAAAKEERLPAAMPAPAVPAEKIAAVAPQKSNADLAIVNGNAVAKDEEAQVPLIPEKKARPSILEEAPAPKIGVDTSFDFGANVAPAPAPKPTNPVAAYQAKINEEFPPGDTLVPTERTIHSKGGVIVDRPAKDKHPRGGVVIRFGSGKEKHLTLKEARKWEVFNEQDFRLIEQERSRKEMKGNGEGAFLIGLIKKYGGFDPRMAGLRSDFFQDLKIPPGILKKGAQSVDKLANELGYDDFHDMLADVRSELETGRPSYNGKRDFHENFQPREVPYGPVRRDTGEREAGTPSRPAKETNEPVRSGTGRNVDDATGQPVAGREGSGEGADAGGKGERYGGDLGNARRVQGRGDSHDVARQSDAGGAEVREGVGLREVYAVKRLQESLLENKEISEGFKKRIAGIKPAHLPLSRAAEGELMSALSKFFGVSKKVIIVDANGLFNGVKALDNYIFIDKDATNLLSKVFVHEFGHFKGKERQDLHDVLWQLVDREKFKKWRAAREATQERSGYPFLSEAAAFEEFTNDMMAEVIHNPEFFERLAAEHVGTFRRMIMWIRAKMIAMGINPEGFGYYFSRPGSFPEAVKQIEDFVRNRIESVPGVTKGDLAFFSPANDRQSWDQWSTKEKQARRLAAEAKKAGDVQTENMWTARADELKRKITAASLSANPEDFFGRAMFSPRDDAPPAMSEMLTDSVYRKKVSDNYFKDETLSANSRLVPQVPQGLKLGMWRYDDWGKGVYGHGMSQLRLLDPSTLLLGEDVDQNGRRPDADRYAEWFKEGKAAPPIEVVETDKGLMRVSDGHRRVASAKKNGVPVLAWVSPSMDVLPGKDGKLSRYNGDPKMPVIKTGLTYEAWKDGTGKRTTPLEGGFSDPGLPVPPDFPMFSPRAQKPYTPDWAAIAASQDVAHQVALRKTWVNSEITTLDNALRIWQDRNVDMLRTKQDIEKQIGALNDEVNFRQKETLAISKVADRQGELKKRFEKPISELIALYNETIESVGEYLSMRHAEEYNDVIAKRNPGFEGPGSGIETEAARKYLEGLSKERREGLEGIEELIRAYSATVEDMMVEYGLETRETIDLWREMYPHYVPFQREGADEGEGIGNRTGKGMNIRGGESKVAHGSSLPITNVLANMFEKGRRTIMRGEKNRVGNATYGAAVKYQNKDFWKAVNPERVSKRRFAALEAEAKALQEEIDMIAQGDFLEDENAGRNADLEAKLKKVEKAIDRWHVDRAELNREMARLGVPAADVEAIFDEPKERYLNPYTKQTAWRVNSAVRDKPYVLATRFKGQDHFLFFNNRNPRALEMAKAMKNMDVEDLHFMLAAMSKYTRVFASLSTQWNVFFGPVNAVRDVQEAMLNLTNTPLAGRQDDVVKMVPKAILGIYKDVRGRRAGMDPDLTDPVVLAANEYRENGGMTGFVTMLADAQERAESIEKELKKITEGKFRGAGRAIIDWVSDYNEALENGTRLAVFMTARENGLSPEQSAAMAKEITVNFNRKGQIASQAGAMYAFFNAAVQGSAVMARTLAGPAGKRILAGGLAFGAMQALFLAAAGYKDDEPPDFVKQRNIIIPWFDEGKNYTMIPLPLGFAILPSLGRMAAEQIIGEGKRPGKLATNLLGLVADTFIPTGGGGNPSSLSKFAVNAVAPTAGRPIAALAINEDYTGRPVFRDNFSFRERTPGFTRTKDSASALGKAVAEFSNWASGGTQDTPGSFSPTADEFDFLVSQYAGGVGREVMKTAITASAVAQGKEILPYKVPLVGRFWGSASGSYAVKNHFYENLRLAYEHKNEIEGRGKRGENIEDYIKKNPEAGAFKMAMAFEGDLDKLKDAKTKANAQGFHAHNRYFDQQAIGMMEEFNKQFDRLKKRK
jgi:hypothetical protein